MNSAEWAFNTDVNNKDKEQALLNETIESGAMRKFYWQEYFKNLSSEDYQAEAIKRQVNILNTLGVSALDTDKLSQFSTITTNMTNIYSAAKICPYQKQNCDLATEGLSLEPGIESIMSSSTDYDELVYAWTSWRNATGAKIKQQFNTYVDLSNEAARLNGFNNQAEYWMHDYETPTFEDDLFNLWEQVKPLYSQLHKFVSNKLKERYGDKLDISDGLLPAHILGNMWAQSWGNIASLVKPYPNASSPDVSAALQQQNYTVLKLFETSNEFYLSLGLEDSAISYNISAGAVIEKPEDRDILCHASAWDFCDKQNYRIKMCTEVNYEDFITIHHEMGHIQYFLLYQNESVSFRDGANPGFHEAVGDTIALSVSTPKHLKEIGLLTDYVDSVEADINTLMNMALEKVAFLPFGFLIDKWRWDIFAGRVTPDQYNTHWWSYRESIQGLKPPVPRSDETDFDAGAKYHVAGNSQYIKYVFILFFIYEG